MNEDLVIFSNSSTDSALTKSSGGKFKSLLQFFCRRSGRLVQPPWILPSTVSFLILQDSYDLLVMTSCGSLYLWDLKANKCIVNKASIVPLLEGLFEKEKEKNGKRKRLITKVELSSGNKFPLVTLSDQSRYIYNRDLEIWLFDETRTAPYRTLYDLLQLEEPENSDENIENNLASQLDDPALFEKLFKDILSSSTGHFIANNLPVSFSEIEMARQLELYVAISQTMGNEKDILAWTCIYFKYCLANRETQKITDILMDYCEKKGPREHLDLGEFVPDFAKEFFVDYSVENTENNISEHLVENRVSINMVKSHHLSNTVAVELKSYLLAMLRVDPNYRYLLEFWQ